MNEVPAELQERPVHVVVVVLGAEIETHGEAGELWGVDALVGGVVLLHPGEWMSSCIAVILDEFSELSQRAAQRSWFCPW